MSWLVEMALFRKDASVQVRAMTDDVGYKVERLFEPNWFLRLFGVKARWEPLTAVGRHGTEWGGTGGVKYFGSREAALRWMDYYIAWEKTQTLP